MKLFVRSKFLFGIAAALLAAFPLSGTAGAARVTQAHRSAYPSHISPAPTRAHPGRAIARSRLPQPTCTTVPISYNVEQDLEEPTQSATAAMVASSGTTYSGINVDGTGCDIALYVPQSTANVTVTDSAIHDGTRAGIVVDTNNATTLYGNTIYNIGDHNGQLFAPDGLQYGFSVLVESSTNAAVQNVDVSQYQKGGLLFLNSTGSITNNVAAGSGPIDYIAANGFQVGSSTLTALSNNQSNFNQYTGGFYGASGYIICDVTVNGVLLTPSLGTHQHLAGNQALYDDIPYYIDQLPC